jgi:hypothetical protein
VPAAEAVAREELPAARARQAHDVLDVRTRSGQRTTYGRIERSAHGGEEEHSSDARADLEAAVADVLVRHPIAREVKQEPERQRGKPRANQRATNCAGGDVQGDDQASTLEPRGVFRARSAEPHLTLDGERGQAEED